MALLNEVRVVSSEEFDMRSYTGARGDVLAVTYGSGSAVAEKGRRLCGDADRWGCEARSWPSEAK